MQIGKVSEITYKRSVKKKLSSDLEGTALGVDAAELLLEDTTVVVSSNCILKWFSGCEEYYLQKTVNMLYEKGGQPEYLQLDINIPLEYEEKKLGKIIKKFDDASKAKNIKIASCRVYKGVADDVIAHITVLGSRNKDIKLMDRRLVKPGMQVVMAGTIAVGGTSVISSLKKDELLKKFNPGFVQRCVELKKYTDIEKVMKIIPKNDTITLHAVSDGGVFSALWELASSADIGIEAYIKRIPVMQETIEVAELFGYNPYMLDGTGALLIICNEGENIVQELNANGIPAEIIGQLTDGKDRVVINKEERRYLEPPRGDEIYKYL